MTCRITNKYPVSYAGFQILLVFGLPNTPGLKVFHSLPSQTKVPLSWLFYERRTLEFQTP